MGDFLLVIVIGLSLGSFATALAWRIPQGLPWAFSKKGEGAVRSCCASCGATLRWRELIPLVSWMVQKGCCRHCGARISTRYPLIEVMVLAGVTGVYAVYGFGSGGVVLMVAIPFLAALLVIDTERMILPDQLTFICALIGLVFITVSAPQGGWAMAWGQYFLSAVIYGGLLWLMGIITKIILKKEALGFGDVKFMAAAGLWLGIGYLSVFFILSGIFGLFWGAGWRMSRRGPVFPFGPALIAAFYACLLLQKAGFDGFLLLY